MSERGEPPGANRAVEGFDEFYHANFPSLVLQLYAYAGDVASAQDAVQEAFTRAWPRWERLNAYDDPVAWVRRVAMNVVANGWRRARAHRAHAHFYRQRAAEGPSPDRVALARALSRLPERQRRAVVLHHVADMSIAEIAAQEGVAEGTVKSWLHRGRTELANQLIESNPGETDA